MPIRVSTTEAAGRGYADIRVGECQVHQLKLDVSSLTGEVDDGGSLPPGLPIRVNGTPVSGSGQAVYGLIGPEPIAIGDEDIFANIILMGAVNRNMIEDNLGRALSANELAAIPAGIVLVAAS
jgi:hypothetical protein